MSTFFWSKVDEGMATIKGFVEQPSAVARQAISPFTSLLPSINEVRIYFLSLRPLFHQSRNKKKYPKCIKYAKLQNHSFEIESTSK